MHLIARVSTERDIAKWQFGREVVGMKRISVRIIQSLSDYPGNTRPCQVEGRYASLFTTSSERECTWRLLKKQLRFVHWLKQLAWELNHHNAPARCLIAPRVPAQFSQSVGVSRLSRTTTNISLAATLKEQVQILDVFVVPLEEDQRFPVKMIFCQRAKRHNLYCEALSSSRGNAFAQMTG